MNKENTIKALREYCERALVLCERYKDDYNIANAFRMQAFGAVTFLQESALCNYIKGLKWRELETFWEEYDEKFKQILGI